MKFLSVYFVLCILYLALTLLFCEKHPTPIIPGPATVSLSVEEAAVTEAWLNLHMANIKQDYQVTVWRDSVQIYHNAAGGDTLIYDSGLLPAHSYTYQVSLFRDETVVDQSEPVTLTTMDTTSHEFTWRIDTIGTHSSVLYDVVIIDENDIWAVGEIYVNNDTTPWIPYNAAHWDGQYWKLKRIQVLYRGSYVTPALEGIFAFSESDIWVTAGVTIHGNGNVWTLYHLWDMGVLPQGGGGVTKLWGSSPSKIYFVGREGTILFYNGQSWIPITTNKNVNYYDIYGAKNDNSGETEIYIVGSLFVLGRELSLLYVSPTGLFSEVDITGLPLNMKSVWFEPDRCVYVAGDGLFRKRLFGKEVWEKVSQDHPGYYKESVRGNGINDVFVAGHTGQISHYNGESWYHYGGRELPQFYGFYTSIAVKGNTVVGVGVFSGALGIISHGTRN